jgi:hypothetical protein
VPVRGPAVARHDNPICGHAYENLASAHLSSNHLE